MSQNGRCIVSLFDMVFIFQIFMKSNRQYGLIRNRFGKKKWRSCSAALLAYANDALDTAVRSVRVQKENFWSVSENQPFSKHVILGGLMSGGRLSYDRSTSVVCALMRSSSPV